MDVRIISAVFVCLLTRALSQSSPGSTVTLPSKQNQSEPTVSGPIGTPTPPALGLLTISWKGQSCEGEVLLMLPGQDPNKCLQQQGAWLLGKDQQRLSNVCTGRRGCKGAPSWKPNRHQEGNITCSTLRVTCKQDNIQSERELMGYKVATGLLCVLVLLVLLGKFTSTSLRAIHNRMSDRRRNRWIGPTQSQSVSYHREKSAVEKKTEKRSSYPALDRLTIIDSREPSSNRNSDFTY